MSGIWTYDLRNIVRRAPMLTLAVNLAALPVTVAWIWLALTLELSSGVFLAVLLSWAALVIFFASLMVAVFETDTWHLVFVELFGVVLWVTSLVKLIRVVRGKDAFPPPES